ncbi:MAG: dienelactone hydrolase family protein [Deltaproteobacteria bacterium]|nr:dienelactone hydrolase family protein [Deltaproteobacteria bacterium]
MDDCIDGFEERSFTALGASRPVYWLGQGPGVLIVHEVPGITREVADFGRRVANHGFTAVLPSLFNEPGVEYGVRDMARALAFACVSREFSLLSRRGASPVTEWLRALGREVHQRCGGRGVGGIGMCLTGNFALTLAADSWVLAPVLSQPSLPVGVSPSHERALHLSDSNLARLRERVRDEQLVVLGLRFTHDFMCPRARFDTLRRELDGGFEAIEIDSGPGNGHRIPRIAHSVLTKDLLDREGHPTRAALDRVLSFLSERLQA